MKDNEDYYQLLQNEEYKTLLDREIQLNNSRERALKNTNASLSAMGMASSGYGQTATSGIESQYLNAMEGANKNYIDSKNNIELQHQQYLEQKDQEAGQNQYQDYLRFANLMTETDDMDKLNNLLNYYGLSTDGQFDYNKAVSLYGEENAKELRYLYETQAQGIQDSIYGRVSVGANDNYQVASQTFTDQNGQTGTVDDEIKLLYNHADVIKRETGWSAQEGDYLQVKSNDTSDAAVVYLVYHNGRWYQTTQQRYQAASSKHSLYSRKNRNDKWYFDGKEFKSSL